MSIGLIFIFYVSCLLFPDGGPVRKINITLLRKVHFEASNRNATLKKSPLSSESVITVIKFTIFFLIHIDQTFFAFLYRDATMRFEIQSLLFIL